MLAAAAIHTFAFKYCLPQESILISVYAETWKFMKIS